MVYSTLKKGEFPFSYFPRDSNVQVTYVRARVYSNTRAHNIYIYTHIILVIMYRTLRRNNPPVVLFHPRQGTYFSRSKLGYLVARIAAASTPFAHTNVVGGRATGEILCSICTLSSFILARSCSHFVLPFSIYFSIHFLFFFLSFFYLDLVSFQCE